MGVVDPGGHYSQPQRGRRRVEVFAVKSALKYSWFNVIVSPNGTVFPDLIQSVANKLRPCLLDMSDYYFLMLRSS